MTQSTYAASHPATTDLRARAREIAADNGFISDFAPETRAEVSNLERSATTTTLPKDVRDLRSLLWSSIDNRESRDLDQVEVCEPLDGGKTRLRLGIADVDQYVPKDSAIDRRAAENTTSLYTGVATFPMLPEELSTDLTSLLEAKERLAVVADLVIDEAGNVTDMTAYRALVVNRAKLTYEAVGMWLAGGAAPEEVVAIAGLADQVRLQDDLARRLRTRRQERGALDLETIEAQPVTSPNGDVVDITVTRKSRARDLIEDFMIAANVAMASFLEARRVPSIRRVVHVPKRWPRLVELAKRYGATLPDEPSSKALAEFLKDRRAADPDTFADLSLSVV
jgi:exoribonuclease-2